MNTIVTAPYAETIWPETIVCDGTDFHHTNIVTNHQDLSFNVMAVWGYEAGSAQGRLYALHAAHRSRDDQWLEVFNRLPGMPVPVSSDKDKATFHVVAAKWPQVTPRNN